MQTDMTDIALEIREKFINLSEIVQVKHRYIYKIWMCLRICFFLCCPSVWCPSLYSLTTSPTYLFSSHFSGGSLNRSKERRERNCVRSATGGLMVTSILNKHSGVLLGGCEKMKRVTQQLPDFHWRAKVATATTPFVLAKHQEAKHDLKWMRC